MSAVTDPAEVSGLLQIMIIAQLKKLHAVAFDEPDARITALRRHPGLSTVYLASLASAALAAVQLAVHAGDPRALRAAAHVAVTCADLAGLPHAVFYFLSLSTGTQLPPALAAAARRRAGSPYAAALSALLHAPLSLDLTALPSDPAASLAALESWAQGRLLPPTAVTDAAAAATTAHPIVILGLSTAHESHPGPARLLLGHWRPTAALCPVTVSLGFPPAAEDGENHPPEFLTSPAALRDHFGGLLEDAARTMRKELFPLDTEPHRQRWWRSRLEVDRRLSLLCNALEKDLLGPWALLLATGPLATEAAVAPLRDRLAAVLSNALGKSVAVGAAAGSLPASLGTFLRLLAAPTAPADALEPAALQSILAAVLRSLSWATEDGRGGGDGGAALQLEPEVIAALCESLQRNRDAAVATKPASWPLGERSVAAAPERGAGAFPSVAVEMLCQVPDPSMNMGGGRLPILTPAPGTTARKTSRLKMLTGAAAAATRAATPAAVKSISRSLNFAALPEDEALMDCSHAVKGTAATHVQTAAAAAVDNGNGTTASSPPAPSPPPPLLLCLDGALQGLPWESLPCLREPRVPVFRALSLAFIRAAGLRRALLAPSSAPPLAPSRGFYLLNPSGDLVDTQRCFEGWFAELGPGWRGHVGRPPPPADYCAALTDAPLFVYMGHGAGDQYLPPRAWRKMDHCATSFLFGCSSGRLGEQGAFEPRGPVLSYLLAGSPVVVANLWDVTDKDIDRFSKDYLGTWMKRVRGPGEEDETGTIVDVGAALPGSRGVCKLPLLIGAAPVSYGIPFG